jgi:predicted DNA-binding protein with PD1-like motif
MKSKKIVDGYIVRCDIGEEVVLTLVQFASENNIESGTVIGIGAVKDVVLGYFDLNRKEYVQKKYDGIYELLSLSGNFARLDSDIILHCHAVISDQEFSVSGGHLFSGIIAVTGEFYIRPGEVKVERAADHATGLKLIRL